MFATFVCRDWLYWFKRPVYILERILAQATIQQPSKGEVVRT